MLYDTDFCATLLGTEEDEKYGGTPNAEALNNDIFPTEYEISLNAADIEKGVYSGDITIHFTIKTTVFYISLNNVKTTITNVWLTLANEENINITVQNTLLDKKNDLFIIYTKQRLKPGNYVMYMTFQNSYNTDHVGLYLESYIEDSEEIQSYVMTHFEPNFARTAFPCFDDPSFQATFQINIARLTDKSVVALANACIEKETVSFPEENLTTTHFMKTKPMPVYMVAFAVGKFCCIPSPPTPADLYINVHVRKDMIDKIEKFKKMVLTVAEISEEFFRLKIFYSKIDIVGLPITLLPIAEYGQLLTFLEKYLLIDDNSSSWEYLKSLTIIAVQIGHLWLTNFVKLKSWDDFWLKQAMATFLGFIFCEIYHMEFYGAWVTLAMNTFAIMKLDGFINSYPIKKTFLRPISFHKIYKTLIFKKSFAVMFMVFFERRRDFRTILYRYFRINTVLTASDFLKTAQEILPFDPAPIFDSYLKQSGYPVLEISSLYGTTHIIEQNSFVNNKYFPRSPSESVYGFNWDIPIYYISENDTKTVHFAFMRKEQKRMSIECLAGNWILLNHKHAGYYRVNYSRTKWTTFAYLLMRTPQILLPEDKAGLIEDAFCLTNSGYFHYNIPFNLTVYLHFHKESHFLPWKVVSDNLREVSYHFMNTPGEIGFLMYVRSLLCASYDEDVWNFNQDDSLVDKLAKIEILNLGGWAGNVVILDEAQKRFTNWFNANEEYDLNLMKIILKYGLIKESSEELWDMVLEKFKTEPNGKFKENCWKALASVKNPELIQTLLEIEKIEVLFDPEVFHRRMKPLLKNNYATEPLWNFLSNNARLFFSKKLVLRQVFRNYLIKVVSKFNTKIKLEEVKFFLTDYSRICSMKRAVESIRSNINWYAAYYDVACEWLHLYVTSIIEIEETLEKEE